MKEREGKERKGSGSEIIIIQSHKKHGALAGTPRPTRQSAWQQDAGNFLDANKLLTRVGDNRCILEHALRVYG